MTPRSFAGLAAFLFVLTPTSVALAQGAPPSPPSAAPAAEEPGPRFRWGISALGGPYFQGGHSGGLGGVDVRLGAQVNSLLGVYAQPVVLIGGGASADESGASASALVMGGAGVLADFTFADIVFVGIGPELLSGATGAASVSTDASGEASGSSGTFFSVAARAGIALGSMKPERRKAFVLGLEFRTIFASDPAIAPTLFLGYDAF